MKNILLATTALVMTAGVASAEITWTGTATAGIARIGSVDAVAAVLSDQQIINGAKSSAAVVTIVVNGVSYASTTVLPLSAATLTATTLPAYKKTNAAVIVTIAKELQTAVTTAAASANVTQAIVRANADIATLDLWLSLHAEWKGSAGLTNIAGATLTNATDGSALVVLLGVTDYLAASGMPKALALASAAAAFGTRDVVYKRYSEAKAEIQGYIRTLGGMSGAAAEVAGDYETYSEINLTGAASVTTDSGLTFKTAISVDAGQGYDLADDDGFDTLRGSRNGGSVGLDFVSVGGAFGTITIDEGDIAHLVDADDNKSGDISYKGTFGDVTVQAVFDQAKDTNAVAVAANRIEGVVAVTPDVAWSAAVSGAVQGVSYRYATDEEGGYAGSLGYTMSGVTVGVSTKLEAAEKDLNLPVHNGVSVAYAVEGLSINGAWDSVADGNQTSWGVGYTAGDVSVAFNTDEKNQWTSTASLALGAGASLNAGVNYTDDAQIGVSFSF